MRSSPRHCFPNDRDLRWRTIPATRSPVLARDASNLRTTALLGDAQRARGNLEAAQAAYGKALALFARLYPDSPEPPVGLIRKSNEVMVELERQSRAQ